MKRAIALCLLLTGCPSTPVVVPTTPASTSASTPTAFPTVTRSPPPDISRPFSVARAQATIRALAALGPREAASHVYRKAADLVATAFRAIDYQVRMQTFAVRSGTVDSIAVHSGTSINVIAEPAGFDPSKPFAVVGGHLDTVPDSPGANDNASGVAVTVELARLARMFSVKIPVVFIAFGAEERRRQHAGSSSCNAPTISQCASGSRAYVASLSRAQRANIRGALICDMVGAGPNVRLLGRGAMIARAVTVARQEAIPWLLDTTNKFSDHMAFRERNISVVWLYAGDHPSFHRPSDKPSVIQPAELQRVGDLARGILRAME